MWGRRIAVLVVAWVMLSAQAPDKGRQPEQAKAAPQARESAPAVPTTPAEAVEEIQPKETERPCEPGQDDRESDLCAQWKAADAASDTAWWAMAAFWLGLVGTVGLLATLYYTRKAVLAAEEATKDADAALAIAERNADAAAAQAKIAKEAADRQLRPYLVFHQAVQATPNLVEGEEPALTFHETIHNQGYSPAVIVSVEIGVSFDREIAPSDFPYELRESEAGVSLGRTNAALNPTVSVPESVLWANDGALIACRVRYRSLWGGENEIYEATDGKWLRFEPVHLEQRVRYLGHDDMPQFRSMS